MRTFIVNYNWPLEYKGTYQVTVEDSVTAGMEAAKKVHNYLVKKFGEVKDSNSTVIEVYGTIHKIDNTKDEERGEEDGTIISKHELKVLKLVAEMDGTCLMGLYNKLKSLPPQLKREWSEKDKLHLNNAILAAEKEWGSDSCTSKWLKSLLLDLKKRNENVAKLCSNEWSEEDKEMYARIVRRYTDYEGVIMRTKEESIANKMLDAMAQEEIWLKQVFGIK